MLVVGKDSAWSIFERKRSSSLEGGTRVLEKRELQTGHRTLCIWFGRVIWRWYRVDRRCWRRINVRLYPKPYNAIISRNGRVLPMNTSKTSFKTRRRRPDMSILLHNFGKALLCWCRVIERCRKWKWILWTPLGAGDHVWRMLEERKSRLRVFIIDEFRDKGRSSWTYAELAVVFVVLVALM